MRLSPLDIRKQEFSRGFRGYEEDEVRSFLEMVSTQWEEMLDELRRKDEKIRELHSKMAHYEKVEEALQEALQTARDTSREVTEGAERKAALIVREAESRADEIRRDAEIERLEIKRETAKLSTRRSEIVTRLRAFLMSEIELLASYEGDDPVGFIKLMPTERARARQLSGNTDVADAENEDPSLADQAAPAVESQAAVEPSSEPAAPADETVTQPSADTYADEEGEADLGEPQGAGESPEPERHVHDWTQTPTAEHEAAAFDELDDALEEDEGEDTYHEDEYDSDQGWTTQTIVSGRSEAASPDASDPDIPEGADEEVRRGSSSEEIEKIRRILSDLD